MEKNCRNCAYFYCNKCYNRKLNINSSIEKEIVEFIEEGYLSELLREEVNLKELFFSTFYTTLQPYFKKAGIKQVKNEDFSEEESIIYEELDNMISRIFADFIQLNKNNKKVGTEISYPDDFYCCEWR